MVAANAALGGSGLVKETTGWANGPGQPNQLNSSFGRGTHFNPAQSTGFQHYYQNNANRGGRGGGRGRGGRGGYKGKCQICKEQGHSALFCDQFKQLQANTAQTGTNNGDWLFDSGATNHITNNVDNLTGAMDYVDTDAVTIGNGKVLSIEHVGKSQISSLNIPNTLHIPDMHVNLISVAKLCK